MGRADRGFMRIRRWAGSFIRIMLIRRSGMRMGIRGWGLIRSIGVVGGRLCRSEAVRQRADGARYILSDDDGSFCRTSSHGSICTRKPSAARSSGSSPAQSDMVSTLPGPSGRSHNASSTWWTTKSDNRRIFVQKSAKPMAACLRAKVDVFFDQRMRFRWSFWAGILLRSLAPALVLVNHGYQRHFGLD